MLVLQICGYYVQKLNQFDIEFAILMTKLKEIMKNTNIYNKSCIPVVCDEDSV